MTAAIPARIAAVLAGVVLTASSGAIAIEASDREAVRVCADANLLPFSNERLEGFENEIARLIGEDLQRPVTYFWWPQTIGFVRNTLRARQCDLVMGTASGEELMQNTNPYYRTVYALVYRKASGLTARTLGDPSLKEARIGIVEKTPAASLMRRYGLTRMEPYQLNTDTRAGNPARDAIEDVAKGRTDAAVIWGRSPAITRRSSRSRWSSCRWCRNRRPRGCSSTSPWASGPTNRSGSTG
ncbi:transporter substrate-binding domain-containing protein [Azospirillum thermophilum]|uniref:transporter substrate-binding domain-containing protein n=1 Tax=Azospirillum thermophilum TaxID=2202148 RepID=UPI001FE397D4|nr:transporter substrate-binding domain-containing protein [Azospirillum thermophilum]